MWRFVAIVPGAIALALAVAQGPVAGSLDDAFVVLADARAWFVGSVSSASPSLPHGISGDGPVEGSTSLLDWCVKGVGLRLFPGSDPLRMAGWLGLIWCIGTVAVSVGAAARWSGSLLVAAGIGCLVALSPGLAESAGYLLEGPLFGLLWILALVAAVEARPRGCWFWSLLLAAARPEALALAPVLMAWAGRLRAGGWWRWGSAGILASGLVTGVRFALYGEWLPNTFYAKSSFSRWSEVEEGASYIFDVLRSGPGPSAVAVALALGVALTLGSSLAAGAEPSSGSSRRPAYGLLALSALYAGGVVVSGGDSYTGARLFMPIGLPVWLALGVSLAERSTRFAMAAIVLPLGALLLSVLGSGDSLDAHDPQRFIRGAVAAFASGPVGLEAFAGDEEVFREIAAALAPDEVFAHLHAQRFRWFEPGAPVLDLTGLTDWEVARQPVEGSVRFGRAAVELALGRRVGAIHLDPLRGRVTALVDAPDLAIALSEPNLARRYLGKPYLRPDLAIELARAYVAGSRRLPDGAGYFNLLVRRDLAEAFRDQGFRVGRD